MAKLTQRDIVETIMGLKTVAEELHRASQGTPLEGMVPQGAVLTKAAALLEISQYLETVVEELKNLIPDKVLPTLPE
jgi:hypothetical protein